MNQEYAITLKPHWAYAVFHLGKDIENRSWALPEKYANRRIWIHSSKKVGRDCFEEALDWMAEFVYADVSFRNIPRAPVFNELPCSTILGSVEFSQEIITPSKWMMPDFQYWKINNPVLLPTPIPTKGKLGFWDCTELVKEVA